MFRADFAGMPVSAVPSNHSVMYLNFELLDVERQDQNMKTNFCVCNIFMNFPSGSYVPL